MLRRPAGTHLPARTPACTRTPWLTTTSHGGCSQRPAPVRDGPANGQHLAREPGWKDSWGQRVLALAMSEGEGCRRLLFSKSSLQTLAPGSSAESRGLAAVCFYVCVTTSC